MPATDDRSLAPADLAATAARWDLQPLLDGAADVDQLLDQAAVIVDGLVETGRGKIATMSATELAAFHRRYAEMIDLTSRAGNYAGLVFAADTSDPANGALVAHVQ